MTIKKTIKLSAIHPNAGTEADFQRKLDAMIKNMHDSLLYWLSAAYKANKPASMAQDASSSAILQAIMARLTRKWLKKFNDASKPMASYYANEAADRTDAALKAALKKSGMTVEFKITPAIQDIITASVNENVSSIKSIASEHLTDVAQIVQRCVQEGRNLGGLQKELVQRYGITKRRAILIARQSNNQASAMIERQRAKEMGIETATWVHSSAGKHPRREHIDWHGTEYNIQTGKWSSVSGKYVWPGTDYNCRCQKRMMLKTAIKVSESAKQRAR